VVEYLPTGTIRRKKMKHAKLIAGALALALLTGCGGITAADPDDLIYQAADIKRDSELFTVDGTGVTAEEYCFWLTSAVMQQKYYGFLADDAAWEETLADGSETLQALKDDAMETAKLYQVIRNKAAEYGVTITEEDQATMDQQVAEVEENSGGADAFNAVLEEQAISREGFLRLNEVYFLNQGLKAKLEETGELAVTDADLDAFIEEQGIYAAKHILLSTRRTLEDGSYEDFSDEEKEAVLQQANDLREQLKAAGDSEELFDELMNEYSEDGRDENGDLAYPQGYTFVPPGQMVSEFEQGARALEVGQISDPIQTAYGYHIILRLSPDKETAKTYLTPDYKLSTLTQQWLDQAQVTTTKAYDELDPHDFYVRLQEIVTARKAAREAAATPTPAESGAPESPAESAPAESGAAD